MSTSPEGTEVAEEAKKPRMSKVIKARVDDAAGFLGGGLLVLTLDPVADLVGLPEGPTEGLLYVGMYLASYGLLASSWATRND